VISGIICQQGELPVMQAFGDASLLTWGRASHITRWYPAISIQNFPIRKIMMPESNAIRLLFVEDDEDDYVLMKTVLSEISHPPIRLTWVDTYDKALEQAEKAPFDIYLLDYRLPGHTGLELLQAFRANGHRQPCILLTGQGDYEVDVQAMVSGASDYLEKDLLSPQLLERVIRYAIDRQNTLNTLRESEKRLRSLSERLIHAQEEERIRIARELHDGTSANLTALKYAIEKKLYETGNLPERPDTHYFKYLIDLIQETSAEIQRIYTDLHPAVLDELGVLAAVRRSCRDFQRVNETVLVTTDLAVDEEDIPENYKIVIYRILQEALSNIAKHSRADHVRLLLEQTDEDGLRLAVTDNGQGFDADSCIFKEARGQSGGFGLMNIRERATFSGGDFYVRSAPGKGTALEIIWPDSGQNDSQ